MRSSSSVCVFCSHLQLEWVRVVRAGSEVGVHSCTATERSSVWRLFIVAVLRLHALPVTGRGVRGAHRLPTWTAETKEKSWTLRGSQWSLVYYCIIAASIAAVSAQTVSRNCFQVLNTCWKLKDARDFFLSLCVCVFGNKKKQKKQLKSSGSGTSRLITAACPPVCPACLFSMTAKSLSGALQRPESKRDVYLQRQERQVGVTRLFRNHRKETRCVKIKASRRSSSLNPLCECMQAATSYSQRTVFFLK